MIRNAVTLLLAFVVSTFVGGMVSTQLAVAFDAGQEFIALLMLFGLSAVVAIAGFGAALYLAKSIRIIDWVALALLGLVVLSVVALALIGARGQSLAVGAQDLPILAEILVPSAVMVGIQWWMVRRRWRKAHSAPPDASPDVLNP